MPALIDPVVGTVQRAGAGTDVCCPAAAGGKCAIAGKYRSGAAVAAPCGCAADYRPAVRQDGILAQAGVRIVTRVARRMLPAAENPAQLLAAVAVRFAGFISAQAGGQPLQLCVPQGDAQEAIGLESWTDTARLKRLTLQHHDPEPLNRLLAQQTAEEPNPDLAQLLVTWLADPSVALQLDGVSAERLLLPPLHTPFELVLALSLPDPDSVLLELVADPRLTPHAAPFLLEQFVASLAGQRITAALLPASERSMSPDNGGTVVDDRVNEEIAQLILAEFRDALAAPEMTLDEDFFDRGGHSLVATRVIGRLLSLHRIELNINDLFSHATARGLSVYAKRQAAAAPVRSGSLRIRAKRYRRRCHWRSTLCGRFTKLLVMMKSSTCRSPSVSSILWMKGRCARRLLT
ncbi:Linear gramicidin synthase subunit D [Serratia plymuthica]|uniref:Linear gramicidin synthase subunit D n=1 Tax=Serratia plymuthica TaxID=82996 RepID=A0A2X4X7D7_SERPL|nr:Linear gramicidin synthase subunit D [Serratia plymuthica]